MDDFTPADRIELHELAARYGNAIDSRNWDRLRVVFTQDCRYELVSFGRLNTVLRGIGALRTYMARSAEHPIAHHVTNVEVDASGDPVRMFSLVIATLPGGSASSAQYQDVVVRTPDGWRISERVVTLRREPRR